ncbi:hypothetical protein LTS08_006982 [Lithohypha guttulata]|nr:hypothetical protein LTS08_006982 [Lithohypha guttulata]
MFQGKPRDPRFNPGDFVHASAVPIVRPSKSSSINPVQHSSPFATTSNHPSRPEGSFENGLTLPPTTLYRVAKVKQSTTDASLHGYVLQPAEQERFTFNVTEEQLIATTPFNIGDIVRRKTDPTARDMWKVKGRGVRLVGETQKPKSGLTAPMLTTDRARRGALEAPPTLYESIKANMDQPVFVATVLVEDELELPKEMDAEDLVVVNDEQKRKWFSG